MRMRVLPVLVVALSVTLSGACGEDPVTTPDNFPQILDCTQACFDDYRAMLDGLVQVLKKVDDPAYALPPGITLDPATGEFGFGLDLDGSAGLDAQLEGIVEPGLASDCSDGMDQDEECDFDWVVTLVVEGDTTAAGINRATDLGVSPPPDETPAMRFSLGPDPTAHVVSQNCGFIISSFSTILQLWDPTTPVTSVSMTFDTFLGEQSMRGYIDWNSGPTNDAALTLEYLGREHECTIDIETFVIDCPE